MLFISSRACSRSPALHRSRAAAQSQRPRTHTLPSPTAQRPGVCFRFLPPPPAPALSHRSPAPPAGWFSCSRSLVDQLCLPHALPLSAAPTQLAAVARIRPTPTPRNCACQRLGLAAPQALSGCHQHTGCPEHRCPGQPRCASTEYPPQTLRSHYAKLVAVQHRSQLRSI